ncbi:MAG: Uncharacterised protein [Cyanobium sp. ARS6]|nr:MAG: Uncharacterised protein [Cyanobium sp. ARS6]
MKRQLLQFHGQPGAVVADGIDQGIHRSGLQLQLQLLSGALHQLALAGPVPDGRKPEVALAGLSSLDAFHQGLGGAQPTVGFGGMAEQQLGAVRDAIQGGFEALGQLAGAGVAEGRSLQQHHPGASAEGWCA